MRSLDVTIGRRLVGTLKEGDDLWQFDYDVQWAQAPDGFDLAPGLPRAQAVHLDGGTTRPVQWYFDNLLPEELLRTAISKEAGIKGEDAFALLEYLGAESAGSLTLLPPGQPLPQNASLRPLADAELSRRIGDLPRQTLTAGAPKRMSLAGAQHKLLVTCLDGVLYEPSGATPSTHILKPNHPDTDNYPASVVNEYVTMRLARAAGLPVPEVHLRYVPQPVYFIDRFDRRWKASGVDAAGMPLLEVQRLHIIDACQLLNRARTFKHSGASLQALSDVIDRTTNKIRSRLGLFRWLVFNLLVANDDCHLKNLSFFQSPDGVQLAKHYDLMATSAYYTKAFANEKATWPDVPMAIALPGATRFSEVTRQAVIAAAGVLGVPPRLAEPTIQEVASKVAAALPLEREALARRHAQAAAESRPYLASEERVLSVMENIVLADMLKRLA
ncbi:MAG: HipA domain-containing protein [Ramlibacter sp.]